MKQPVVKKKKHFVNNKSLLEEIIKSKEKFAAKPEDGYCQAMTPLLVAMLREMIEKYSVKKNWASYSYLDELKDQAMLTLCEKWHQFDPYRENPNPFAYYTTVITNSFKGQIIKEKKPQKIKDALLKSMGYTPSFGQQLDDEADLVSIYDTQQKENSYHSDMDNGNDPE